MTVTIAQRGQQREVGEYVELFSIDTSPYDGPVIFFTPSRPTTEKPIIWNGQTYVTADVQTEGFEKTTTGTLPRPRLSTGNADNIVGARLVAYNNFLGCTVTRTKTLVEFLDDQPGADPTQYWPLDIYKVERPVSRNKLKVVLELSSAIDNAGARLPRCTILRDTCRFFYRRYKSGDFDYTKATCPYAGGSFFDRNGAVCEAAGDNCGKRLSDCKLRFGSNAELPFGAFPGVGRT